MKLVAWAVLATAFIGANPTRSQDLSVFINGENVTTQCRAWKKLTELRNQTTDLQLAFDAGRCISYVEMIYDADAFQRDHNLHSVYIPKFCVPPTTRSSALAEAVANFADAHPEKRTLAGYVFIQQALASFWPCADGE